MLSCEYCEFFKNTYFQEHLQTTASNNTVFSWKSISDKCFYSALFWKKHLKEVHLLRNSQQNVCTIIWLLLCYNIEFAIIRIIVEL